MLYCICLADHQNLCCIVAAIAGRATLTRYEQEFGFSPVGSGAERWMPVRMGGMRGGPRAMRGGLPPFLHRGRGSRRMRGGTPYRGMSRGTRGSLTLRGGEMWVGGSS